MTQRAVEGPYWLYLRSIAARIVGTSFPSRIICITSRVMSMQMLQP